MWEKYRDRFGFKFIPEYHIEQATLRDLDLSALKSQAETDRFRIIDENSLESDRDRLLEKLFQFDYDMNGGFDRKSWLENYAMSYPRGVIKAAVKDEDKVCGYGLCRPDALGRLILAPIYADTEEIAEYLIFRLLSESYTPEKVIHFSYLSTNDFMKLLVGKLGDLVELSKNVHEFSQKIVEFDQKKVFCLGGTDVSHI